MYQEAKYFTNYYASLLAGYEAQDKYPPEDCRANMIDMMAEWDFYNEALLALDESNTINTWHLLAPYHRYLPSKDVWASKTSDGIIFGFGKRAFCTIRAMIQYSAAIQSAMCQSKQSRLRLHGLNVGMASNRMMKSMRKHEEMIAQALG